MIEFCRECQDELPADFILWGKFFPPEAFGPRCAFHASKYFPLGLADQYAVLDLRSLHKVDLGQLPPADKLEWIADWLDMMDPLIINIFATQPASAERESAIKTVRGELVQKDLRQWAEYLDGLT